MKRQRIEMEHRERQRMERAERAERRDVLMLQQRNVKTERMKRIDIISSLPDCLLIHILSFLPTQVAVLTGILSSRWRNLWKLVPVLHLGSFQHRPTSRCVVDDAFPFVDTVSRIWTLRNAAIPLRKFLLHWSFNCDSFYVHTMVRDTILRGGGSVLQELDLSVHTDHCNRPLELPCSLYFCSALVVLKLNGDILLNPPFDSKFPSLKILQLRLVNYANYDSLATLLAACPILQHLTLGVINSYLTISDINAGKFDIAVLVPTLKRLYFNCFLFAWEYKLRINTPALEYFCFKGRLGNDVVLENLHSLVESVLDVEKSNFKNIEDDAKRVWDFMRPLYYVKSMKLCIKTAEILWNASNNNDLPMFHNLSSLEIIGNPWLWSKCYAWHAIHLLLSRAPKLQILVFELDPYCLRSSYAPKVRLEDPLDVPECLSSHLTTCHYKTLLGKKFEMEIVRKILKAARVLKTMNITVESHLSSEAKLRICQKLMKFRRSSKTCQIAFE